MYSLIADIEYLLWQAYGKYVGCKPYPEVWCHEIEKSSKFALTSLAQFTGLSNTIGSELIADPGVTSSIPATFILDWSWNIFSWFKMGWCHLQATVYYMHEVLVNCLVKLAEENAWFG